MAWAPSYIDGEELAAYLQISDTDDGTELDDAAEAAARTIDFDTGRQFGLVEAAETRTYPAKWNGHDGLWEVDIDDLMTTVDLVVTVDSTAVSASNYELWPRNRPQKGKPWETLRLEDVTDAVLGKGPPTVDISARWGWSSTPRGIKSANKVLGARYFARRRAPFGVMGSPQQGGEIRIDRQRDGDVAKMVRPFWRLSKARGFA